MDQAATTWALIVGIDVYQSRDLRPLKGAVADAVAARDWLRSIGVLDEHIYLHLSPTEVRGVELARKLEWAPADERTIKTSVVHLLNVNGGTRLFVILAGHGVWEPAGGRLFLTQDFGVDTLFPNLGIDDYIRVFRSMPFRHQFLFVDGCQNYPYPESTRTRIRPGLFDWADLTPRPENGLLACFGASQGQRAVEIGERGAFLNRLLCALSPSELTTLPPDDPRQECLAFDLVTGERHVPLDALFQNEIRPKVQAEAAAKRITQTPTIEYYGEAGSWSGKAIRLLPDCPTALVEIGVDPKDAIRSIRNIRIITDDPPLNKRLPARPETELELPLQCKLPKGALVRAQCFVDPNVVGLADRRMEFETRFDRYQLVFKLLADQQPGGRIASVFSVKLLNPDGTGRHDMGSRHERYAAVAAELGTQVPQSGVEIEDGVRIELHEDGPVFIADEEKKETAETTVSAWASGILKLIPEGVLALGLPSTSVEQPNLRFVLEPNHAVELARPLAAARLVSIEPLGTPPKAGPWRAIGASGYALASLEKSPALRVQPGPSRIHVGLPWGSWTRLVTAPDSGSVEIRLPPSVGTPPLRVSLRRSIENGGGRILLRSTSNEVEVAFAGIELKDERVIEAQIIRDQVEVEPTYHINVPEALRWEYPIAVITHHAAGQLRFPLFHTTRLAVEISADFARVEPLSDLEIPEWDFLVAGCLDVLTEGDALALAEQHPLDSLLVLAAAYSAYARCARDQLSKILDNFARHGRTSVPDFLLLKVVAKHGYIGSLDAKDFAEIASCAAARSVPVFRWGVRLALFLLARLVDMPAEFGAWRRSLEKIERSLLSGSAWTAWTIGR